MKVHLAAQVMSDSVANAVQFLYGEEVKETITFIRHINKFFYCLNVRRVFEGRNKRNENVNVFSAVDDPRLEYLLNDFIGYLDDWEKEVKKRNGNFCCFAAFCNGIES